MIQTIRVPNFNTNNIVQQTQLNASIDAGASSLNVVNNEGFVAGFGLAGTAGSETGEIVTITGKTGNNTVTVSPNTKQAHREYETVLMLFGDQVKLYRAPNTDGLQPNDSDFVSVGSPVGISADRTYSELTDPDGGAGFWYKFTYFNSDSSSETDLSTSKASRGGGGINYCSLFAIRHEAGFDNAEYITDQMIDDKRQAAQAEVNSMLSGVYTLPFTDPVNPFITDIAVRLAAGLLLTTQYTSIHTMQNSDGENKMKTARADLTALALKQKILTDSNGTNIALPGGDGSVSGWPNAQTENSPASIGGAPRVFRMSDIDGYRSRKF